MVIGSENMPAIPLNTILEQTMIPSVEKVKEKILEDISLFTKGIEQSDDLTFMVTRVK